MNRSSLHVLLEIILGILDRIFIDGVVMRTCDNVSRAEFIAARDMLRRIYRMTDELPF